MVCVATYDPGRASAAVRRVLRETAAEERVLGPLSPADAARLAVHVAGDLDAGVAEQITDAAGRIHYLQTVKRPIVGPDNMVRQRVIIALGAIGPAAEPAVPALTQAARVDPLAEESIRKIRKK